MEEKAYCEYCDKRTEYIPVKQEIKEKVKDRILYYNGIKTYCKECGREVYVRKYDDNNTEIVHDLINNGKIREALKTIKEECVRCTSAQCESNCLIYKILGDCIAVNTVPETWKV